MPGEVTSFDVLAEGLGVEIQSCGELGLIEVAARGQGGPHRRRQVIGCQGKGFAHFSLR